MKPFEPTESVVRFVLDRIDSVPHLEALLLLWEAPSRTWTEKEIAERIYLTAEAAGGILQDLVRRRLAAVDQQSAAVYRYDGAWDPTGEQMTAVADAYRRHLVRLASLIHSKGSPAMRDFARAFQFRRDRK